MSTATHPLDLFRLDDTVVVITGASAGLGERMARVMHAVGATVVISARRRERLEALADELGRDRVTPIAADMANEDDRERLIAETIEAHGRVDVLVNNAGITEVVGIEEESLELFRRV
ncbi:MAG: SDR family NAD(P)-dependent oxidoreductase, partial [Actinomycetota bacterium]|nr:SDR family NAD(P)-dependent oxidoreductase [Actinomycetota bacterium]